MINVTFIVKYKIFFTKAKITCDRDVSSHLSAVSILGNTFIQKPSSDCHTNLSKPI